MSAPALSLPEIHALVGDRVEYEPREPRLQGAVPVDRLQYQPAPPMLEIKQRSWSPLGRISHLVLFELWRSVRQRANRGRRRGIWWKRRWPGPLSTLWARYCALCAPILGNGCNETYMKPSVREADYPFGYHRSLVRSRAARDRRDRPQPQSSRLE